MNRVMVAKHIHEEPVVLAPLFEGEPGVIQDQFPLGPTHHNEVNEVRGIQRSRMGRPRPRGSFLGLTNQGLEPFHATFVVNRTTSNGIAQSNFVRVAVNRGTTSEIATASDES